MDPDPIALWRQVQLLHLQLTQVLHRALVDEVGLTYQDFVILAELADGPRRVLELARTLGLEKSRLSHHLSRMGERGLVAKRPAAEDRRGAVVEVTAAGRRLHARAVRGHHERVQRLFGDHLTAAEARALASFSRKVRDGLGTT